MVHFGVGKYSLEIEKPGLHGSTDPSSDAMSLLLKIFFPCNQDLEDGSLKFISCFFLCFLTSSEPKIYTFLQRLLNLRLKAWNAIWNENVNVKIL